MPKEVSFVTVEILILCLVSACIGALSRIIIDNFRKHTGVIQLKMDTTVNRPIMSIQLYDNPLYMKSGTKYTLRLENNVIDEYLNRDP